MSQDQIEVTEETTEVVDGEETETVEVKESAEDSVRRAIDELTKEPEEKAAETESEETEPENKVDNDESEDDDSKISAQSVSDKFEPPTRWTVEAKEWFNKQPKEYQKEIVRQNRDFEGHTTKLWQEINRQKSRYDGIDQIIKKYGEEWNLKGVADVAAIAELAATEQQLRKDPEGTIARLIKALRVDPEKLLGKVSGKSEGASSNPATPEVLALRQELEEIKNWRQGIANQSSNQAAESVAAEVRSVQNLTDSSGRYLYPQLHESAFLEQVKPFVVRAKEAQPGISWSEATKRGYFALQSINGSPSLQQQTKLPAQTPNTNRSRARLVTVAGQSSGGSALSGASMDDVKVPKSAEDTARLVMNMLKRG